MGGGSVLGATGFIGNVLLQSLIKEGWRIKALARRPRANDESRQWIEGDLDNPDALGSLVEVYLLSDIALAGLEAVPLGLHRYQCCRHK